MLQHEGLACELQTCRPPGNALLMTMSDVAQRGTKHVPVMLSDLNHTAVMACGCSSNVIRCDALLLSLATLFIVSELQD